MSVVICARNDGHGGDMLRRMQVTTDGLLEQLEKYHIESELILVEWNPPSDKPLLKDTIKWREGLKYCTIRAITVPPSAFEKYGHSCISPSSAIVAINAGIRRARGKFILQGVIGLLYSDELMKYIASRRLKENERYRVDRCDVDKGVVQLSTLVGKGVVRPSTLEEQLQYCKKHIIRVDGLPPKIVQWVLYRSLPKLHTNACGDFQLMSKENWHKLYGYCEDSHIVSHVDSLMSYASYALGIKEIVLKSPMNIYHIDHQGKLDERIKRVGIYPRFERWLSSLPMPEGLRNNLVSLYFAILELMGGKIISSIDGVRSLDSSECRRMCREILKGNRSNIFNDENWGLGEECLEEIAVRG